MIDFIYVLGAIAFFVLCWLLARVCERF